MKTKNIIDTWKAASRIRKWEDFRKSEYSPKFKAMSEAVDQALKTMSFNTSGCLTHGQNGFGFMLTASAVDSDGKQVCAWKKIYIPVNIENLVTNFRDELHQFANKVCSELSELAFHWDKKLFDYGQSNERKRAMGFPSQLIK